MPAHSSLKLPLIQINSGLPPMQIPTHIMIIAPLYAWTSWHDIKQSWRPITWRYRVHLVSGSMPKQDSPEKYTKRHCSSVHISVHEPCDCGLNGTRSGLRELKLTPCKRLLMVYGSLSFLIILPQI